MNEKDCISSSFFAIVNSSCLAYSIIQYDWQRLYYYTLKKLLFCGNAEVIFITINVAIAVALKQKHCNCNHFISIID